jgi:hypothetical protein
MRWWHWLILAAIGIVVWRKRATVAAMAGGAGTAPTPMGRGDASTSPDGTGTPARHTDQSAVWAYGKQHWIGGGGDPNKIHQADQNLYPGFWVNEFGGFYNPSTGEGFPPGTSPVVYGPNAYETGAMQRPEPNLNQVISANYDPAAAAAGYYNVS